MAKLVANHVGTILPVGYADVVNISEGRMNNSTNDSEVREVLDMFSKLRISESVDKNSTEQVLLHPTASDIETWFEIEDDMDVRAAMVDDFTQALEEFDSAADAPGHITICEDENENDEEDVAAICQLPVIAEVYSLLRALQNLAYDCNVHDASASLQRALSAFTDAIHKANVGKFFAGRRRNPANRAR